MFFKTIKRNNQKKLENDTYILGVITLLVFVFWLLTQYNRTHGDNYLLLPVVLGLILTVIKAFYVFKGNIILFRNRLIILDVSSGLLNIKYQNIKDVIICDDENHSFSQIKTYGENKIDVSPIVFTKNTREKFVVFCQAPDDFYKAIKIRGQLNNQGNNQGTVL